MSTTRRRKRKQSAETAQLETLQAELDEAVELLRRHWPDASDETLRDRAIAMRAERYAKGRWPTDQEIEEIKKTEAAKAAELTNDHA